ncbi:MAG: BON domain-containing protein [Alphaproteobacteria bacterium]|jgi:hyperosmotically inducible periplasmic protein|nr:BON domain-containing protein [Alphaproteobacteria bacterium]MBT4084764.1 BON domain-containing protein [Alphaproteobacteria bacterium]MBT4544720.1 BON domain-containing protein [Alphaproteobacteria bacterium]MBT7745902.1 BON domain-containing protein [Alphaproteobacteria bacterium]
MSHRFLIATICATLLLAAHVPTATALDLNPLTALKSVVEAAVEDRTADDIASDLAIKGKLTANVIDKMGSDVISIGADVYEQVVMLTGTVETGKQKTQAGRLAKDVENVKNVYNEILVIKAIDKEKGSVENYVDDSVIETKINAQLLDAGGVSVTNYRYRSVGGRVFLLGRALSNAELKKALGIVKGIDGVKSVKSRIFVRAKK